MTTTEGTTTTRGLAVGNKTVSKTHRFIMLVPFLGSAMVILLQLRPFQVVNSGFAMGQQQQQQEAQETDRDAYAAPLSSSTLSGSSSLSSPQQSSSPPPTSSGTVPLPKEPSGPTKNRKGHHVVDCNVQVLTKDSPGSGDPNGGMAELAKRWTITDPPFWISLHKEHFDKMRWVSIMLKGNYYETGITKQFRQILANQTPGLVLDIGMNIGWFTLYARALGHRVAGFEPNPIMHTRVCESLMLNGWHNDSSVTILPYGLGEHTAVLNLTMGKNPGSSSFYEERLAKKFRRYISVDVVPLDSIAIQEGWLAQDATPIHLMKVDVEGFELFVFKGGKGLLHSGKIQNIIMENSISDAQASYDLIATIAQAGYTIELLSSVNGDRVQEKMLPNLQRAIRNITPGTDAETAGGQIAYLATHTCNIWWKKLQ